MKHLKDFKLFELLSVEGTPNPDKKYLVCWEKGKIYINPDQTQLLHLMFGAVKMVFDDNKKEIEMQPIDDWANLKTIHSIQNAIKDFKKAKMIDDSWTLTVSTKEETERSLGGVSIKDVLKYDASYSRTIPICFHGTTDKNLKTIQKMGIIPSKHGKGKKNWKKGYIEESKENVYLTMDYERAVYYAEMAAEAHKGTKPVVIEIKNLPVDNILSDDDYKTIGSMSILQMLRAGSNNKRDKDNYIQGIRNTGQFAIKGRIPPSMLGFVYKGEDL